MTKTEKTQIIETLTAEFKASSAIAVCDYKGLTVRQFEALRRAARDNGAKVQVVKNTLAGIALENADAKGLELKETNVFVWSDDQIALSKTIMKFAETSNEKFKVKFGYYEGSVVDAAHIETVSKLPSRDELIGMLLSVWTAPARYFVTALDNLKKQKEEN
ncbi:50S ribosomal protein L10 [Wolinella succinogenes]|uniref:Large ribosomal subunit protein uL10 n=1 Tax=Wolinella succinogenes (strain ATCC 29543 / DSM 1740 / CCUG 13145 / JCM 31913 / LMG 7466 / NCTC 11488 / FDC 602W) TaxID=273121 RepID=RL10_WOLSU|nr:50S ribosomal protein L10 [Wolinella succinogenes]Q7MA58.1 RecName: Full=Large ribosomal subunit protein uL10; AltName: Full=50S ribosomal protein L10 [Wolinella succinogenes DSM 1740]HCZ18278.1 50S ribosomal protein L10 [Helicobacter sp.]NLU34600.1 50S ribosomal protein L10 [Wolinella succinogenes]CAE09605.1 PUTATIVE 50S RIBOSOMAL PROTEIN L10 [Wolinella succinogenes]VEG81820.1 50S ribosomal protein L10 [Wolinella succinogenes]